MVVNINKVIRGKLQENSQLQTKKILIIKSSLELILVHTEIVNNEEPIRTSTSRFSKRRLAIRGSSEQETTAMGSL